MTNGESDGPAAAVELPASRRRAPKPQNRAEAQLQARVAELEARVSEITRCLEAAESEAELARRRAADAERTLEMVRATRTWRMTGPLRSGMGRLRHMLGH